MYIITFCDYGSVLLNPNCQVCQTIYTISSYQSLDILSLPSILKCNPELCELKYIRYFPTNTMPSLLGLRHESSRVYIRAASGRNGSLFFLFFLFCRNQVHICGGRCTERERVDVMDLRLFVKYKVLDHYRDIKTGQWIWLNCHLDQSFSVRQKVFEPGRITMLQSSAVVVIVVSSSFISHPEQAQYKTLCVFMSTLWVKNVVTSF